MPEKIQFTVVAKRPDSAETSALTTLQPDEPNITRTGSNPAEQMGGTKQRRCAQVVLDHPKQGKSFAHYAD